MRSYPAVVDARLKKKIVEHRRSLAGAMAATKIVSFLRSDTPGVIALIGPSGCGKRHAIAEAARQAGVVITHHDLAQGAVIWGRLGSHQLTPDGVARSIHVVSSASESFLNDYTFAKKPNAKIILVADDAGPSMRASGVPVVRMQAMSSDAMAKKLFLDLDVPAEEAAAAARAAKGDWHQLHARAQLCPHHTDVPSECSGKDAPLDDAPPCFVANQLLNGTAPESCPLDDSVVTWTERNLGLHCENIEDIAAAQESMAATSTCLHASEASGAELFRLAARLNTKHVYYQPGLYKNPHQRNESSVSAIKESFSRSRDTHVRLLKKRRLEERDEQSQEEAPKPKAKARRAAKSHAAPKRATRVAPRSKASVPC